MSRKTYDIAGIANELEGASLFFPAKVPSQSVADPGQVQNPAERVSPLSTGSNNEQVTREVSESRRSPTLPPTTVSRARRNESTNKLASKLASSQVSRVEAIRRAVKDPGTKTSFVRLTPAEKNRLVDLVYTYKRQGVNTSENQLARIAISFLLEDYQDCGQESVLAKVIAALNA